jgi:S1-C subfamily serine protease
MRLPLARRLRPALAVSIGAALLLSACNAGPITTGIDDLQASPQITGAPAALPSPNAQYNASTDPVVQVVERVAPAVVNVTTNTITRDAIFGGSQEDQAVGTGFIIRSDGVLVTNFHVVEGALRIKVTLPPPDGRSFTARVIGGDSAHDLAVLKVNGSGLPTMPLGDSDHLKLGEQVIALGYALALPGGPTVTTGIISSLARTVRAQDPNGGPDGGPITRTYEDVLQTDAAINPGNSGGPLVDLAGNVVGINTAGAGEAENVGFSIAINAARPMIDRSVEHPEAPTPYLGVSTTTVGAGLAAQYDLPVDEGALVVQVVPDGPAEKAGIREGDVIVAFDGTQVLSSDDLGAAILERDPGDTVQVSVVRENGDRVSVTATLGSRPLPA